MQITSKVTINLPVEDALKKVNNDEFGLFVANEWKRIIDPLTPRDTGILRQNVEIIPFAIWYKEPYAHYVYIGEKYVDPKYGVSGFFSPDYGFWSRPGVDKIPSGEPLTYKGNGTDHWDKKSAETGGLTKLYRTINNAFKSGKF